MADGLSVGLMKNIYGALTTGSGDVSFCCSCIRNQNKEAASNDPLSFGLKLLKINMMCRIPYLKHKLFSIPIGEKCLSQTFVRPEICDIASGMLDNTSLITDIFESVLVSVKDKNELYLELEQKNKIKGFASTRAKLDKSDIDIERIYNIINSRLGCRLTPKPELELIAGNYIKNRYAARLIDIAICNGVRVTAAIKSCYHREFIEAVLASFKISVDELIVVNDSKSLSSVKVGSNTGVFSSEFDKYIRPFAKCGCMPIYYRSPKLMLKQAKHPRLSREFCAIYDGVCGTRIFSGKERFDFLYELFYLCAAPAVFGFAAEAADKARLGEKVFINCSEDSVFAKILGKLCPNTDKFIFSDAQAVHIKSKIALSFVKDGRNLFSNYINLPADATSELEKILIGNCYDVFKNDKNSLKTAKKALCDFADDFCRYYKKSGNIPHISGEDARALYICGKQRLFEQSR